MRKREAEGPPLTKEELGSLSLKSYENAVELVSEAELLFAHSHFARTLFLSQIAGEELGKCFIALTAIPFVILGKIDWPHFWWRFRNHNEKLTSVHFFEDLALQPDLPDFSAIQSQVSMLDKGKLASLYSDVMSEQEGVFLAFKPNDLFAEEIARNCFVWAQNRVKLYGATVLPLLDEGFIERFSAAELEKFARTRNGRHADLLLKSVRDMQ